MIEKELLNKNRVLTLDKNTRGTWLVVNISTESATMIVIDENGYGTTNENIQFIKTFENKTYSELVDSARWICQEFSVARVLIESIGLGLGFVDAFRNNVPNTQIDVREFNKMSSVNKDKLIMYAKGMINKNLENGTLKFLQTPECAVNTYKYKFLGYSEVMEAHRETDLLIDELCNLDIKIISNKGVLDRIDKDITKNRASCLLLYYLYLSDLENKAVETIEIDGNSEIIINGMNAYKIIKKTDKLTVVNALFDIEVIQESSKLCYEISKGDDLCVIKALQEGNITLRVYDRNNHDLYADKKVRFKKAF